MMHQYRDWKVKSEENPKREYVVTFSKLAGWSCLCPDFFYRKEHIGGDCKHIRQIREQLNGKRHG